MLPMICRHNRFQMFMQQIQPADYCPAAEALFDGSYKAWGLVKRVVERKRKRFVRRRVCFCSLITAGGPLETTKLARRTHGGMVCAPVQQDLH